MDLLLRLRHILLLNKKCPFGATNTERATENTHPTTDRGSLPIYHSRFAPERQGKYGKLHQMQIRASRRRPVLSRLREATNPGSKEIPKADQWHRLHFKAFREPRAPLDGPQE